MGPRTHLDTSQQSSGILSAMFYNWMVAMLNHSPDVTKLGDGGYETWPLVSTSSEPNILLWPYTEWMNGWMLELDRNLSTFPYLAPWIFAMSSPQFQPCSSPYVGETLILISMSRWPPYSPLLLTGSPFSSPVPSTFMLSALSSIVPHQWDTLREWKHAPKQKPRSWSLAANLYNANLLPACFTCCSCTKT